MFGIEWLRSGAVVDRETSLLQTVEEVKQYPNGLNRLGDSRIS